MNNGISPLASVQGADPSIQAGLRAGASRAETVPAEPAGVQAPPFPNPSLRIDGALGLVVLEFHDSSGRVASSIPSARQLDAYRRSAGQAASPTAEHGTAEAAPPTPGAPDRAPLPGTPIGANATGPNAAGPNATGVTGTGSKLPAASALIA